MRAGCLGVCILKGTAALTAKAGARTKGSRKISGREVAEQGRTCVLRPNFDPLG